MATEVPVSTPAPVAASASSTEAPTIQQSALRAVLTKVYEGGKEAVSQVLPHP
jgi:hypothetical protein